MEKNEASSDDEMYERKGEKWSSERVEKEIEEMKKHPLFCQDITNLDDNEEMLALQSLLYDDDKADELESARIFKKHGDEVFRERVMPLLKRGDLNRIKDPNLRISLKGAEASHLTLRPQEILFIQGSAQIRRGAPQKLQ